MSDGQQPETDLGDVITLVDGKPQKFQVMRATLHPSSMDLTHYWGWAYRLVDIRTGKVRFVAKVASDLERRLGGDNYNLHRIVIFKLVEAVQRLPHHNETEIEDISVDLMEQCEKRHGRSLRTEILRFIYQANHAIPDLGISKFDLLENIWCDAEQVNLWTSDLMRAGCLTDAGLKTYPRAKVGVPTFKIDPKRFDEIAGQFTVSPKADTNPFYKVVDLEAERFGKFSFVIMPFKDEEITQQIYHGLIKPIAQKSLGFPCIRNDEDRLAFQLDDKFFTHIVKCEIVIAELSSLNANVIYEMGIAHSFGKTVILLIQNGSPGSRLPFDYNKFPVVFYATEEELRIGLTEKLDAHR